MSLNIRLYQDITYTLYIRLNFFLRTIKWAQIIFRKCNRILENTRIQVIGCQFVIIMIYEVRKLTSFQIEAYCIQVSQQVKNKQDAIKQYWTGVDGYFILPNFWFSALVSWEKM